MFEILVLLDLERDTLLLLVNSLVLSEQVPLHVGRLLLELVHVRLHHTGLLDLLGHAPLGLSDTLSVTLH